MADKVLKKLNLKEGAQLPVSTANVTTPTDAELDSALGTAASKGAGYVQLIDDNGAGTAVHLVASDGTNWHFVSFTKAS